MSPEQITDQIIELLLLADFAPLISVAIAINLVASFWAGIKNKSVNNLNDRKKSFIEELNAVYTSGNCSGSDSLTHLETTADKYIKRLSKLSSAATTLGVVVVVILLCLLALIGFLPQTHITTLHAILICFICIVPSNVLRIVGMFYSKHAVKKLEECSNLIKNSAKSAIKDNQQAAYTKE